MCQYLLLQSGSPEARERGCCFGHQSEATQAEQGETEGRAANARSSLWGLALCTTDHSLGKKSRMNRPRRDPGGEKVSCQNKVPLPVIQPYHTFHWAGVAQPGLCSKRKKVRQREQGNDLPPAVSSSKARQCHNLLTCLRFWTIYFTHLQPILSASRNHMGGYFVLLPIFIEDSFSPQKIKWKCQNSSCISSRGGLT
jgi:hypothetical protein